MSATPGLCRAQRLAAGLALLGIVGAGFGWWQDPGAFFRAYHVAVTTAFLIPLGCLGLSLVHHLTGGRWGLLLSEAFRAGARSLPLLALLFIPVLLEVQTVFPWARPEFLVEHEIVAQKSGYLNEPFFVVRSAVYLVVWVALALAVAGRPAKPSPRRHWLGALGLVLLVPTVSFASIDWILSLAPTFHSSVFGMLMLASTAVAGLAFAIVATRGLGPALRDERLHAQREAEAGRLLAALSLLWIYFAFMQYLIGWSGDLPHVAEWYLARQEGPWRWIGAGVVAAHLFAFVLLLSPRLRTRRGILSALCGVLLLARVLDCTWLSLPAFGADGPPAWLALAALLAVGGLWLLAMLVLAPTADRVPGRTSGEAGRG